jgi:predicted nucleic acid-binding protein
VAPKRRGIVIDASIAKAAGRHDHPVSSGSRRFLEEVRRICHSFVATDVLLTEWKNHASSLALDWLRSMFARRKVDRLHPVPNEGFHTKISGTAPTEGESAQMLKDVHLVEAALEGGSPIASLDERARDSFSAASRAVASLRAVVWVNPSKDEENVLEWLRSGAQSEASRCLGFGAGD